MANAALRDANDDEAPPKRPRDDATADVAAPAPGKWARSHAFRDFIMTTFSAAQRRQVLDVAGGKGELAMPLVLAGVACTIIDPRTVDLRATKLMRNIQFHLSRGGTKTGDMLRARLGLPAPPASDDDAEAADAANAPVAIPMPGELRELFAAHDRDDSDAMQSAKRDATLVVGMHADQATEPIVDFALQHRLPFAVAPCCVFPKENPNRRYTDPATGAVKAVRTYDDFVVYLQAKHAAIRRVTLPFGGRNVVLYCADWGAADDAAV